MIRSQRREVLMKRLKDRSIVAGMLAAALLGWAFAAWVLGGSAAHAQHAGPPASCGSI